MPVECGTDSSDNPLLSGKGVRRPGLGRWIGIGSATHFQAEGRRAESANQAPLLQRQRQRSLAKRPSGGWTWRAAMARLLLPVSVPVPVPISASIVLLSSSSTSTNTARRRGHIVRVRVRVAVPATQGQEGHHYPNSPVPSRTFGQCPASPTSWQDDSRSSSSPQPLPLPPGSPCLPSRSLQWKKGKLLGSGTFGQVYMGFNRYFDFEALCFSHISSDE